MRTSAPKMLLLFAVIMAIGALWSMGAFSDLDVATLTARLQAAGPWGWVVYILSMSFIAAAGMSTHPFLIASSLVWRPELAILLSWVGTLGSATVGFGFARFVARDQVQRRSPARFKKYDQALAERGFRTVFVLRLLFFTTPWMQLMMGASRVRFRDYMAATAVGNLPTIVIIILLSEQITAWYTAHPMETWPWGWVVAGALGVASVGTAVGVWGWRRGAEAERVLA